MTADDIKRARQIADDCEGPSAQALDEALDEIERLNDSLEFKQAILAADDKDSLYIENDRYWMTGKQINAMLYYTDKLRVVFDAAKLAMADSKRIMGCDEWIKEETNYEKLENALKALDDNK